MTDFDHNALDELIHGRVRLAAMTFLSTVGEAEFTLIRDRVEATDGNLSVHLKKLEDAGYIKMKKRFVNRKPQTTVVLTDAGRRAFVAYLDKLDSLLKSGGLI